MTQKSILITGCSSGIGYDAAHCLHKRGWRVFATCRDQKDCDRLAAEGLESFTLDIANTESISQAVSTCVSQTGGTLNALFNNAAFGIPGAVEDLPTDALRDIFETNLFGLHELTRQVIPLMRAQGHGRIVNNSSVLGFAALRWRGAYVATKYALEGLTDTLRLEMRDTSIHVILVEPGPVTSKIRVNSIPHFERWINWKASPRRARYESLLIPRLYHSNGPDVFELPPQAVSKKLIHALENPRPRPRYYVTTPTYGFGILKRILPTRASDWILAKI